MLTTSGANATEQFRAYGAVRGYSGSNPSRYQFTGQYIDNTGLYYYNARYYDPQIGTFLSPDTLVPDPGNVQAYNRYLYALGNPIRYNDPTGHCGTSVLSGGGTAALDIACLEALGEAIAAVASEAAPPVAAAGATAAVGAGAYLAASWAMQDNGPTVPPIQPERLPGDGFTVTIPVPNSSTVTSGMPLGTGVDASVPAITPINNPLQQLVDPLPESKKATELLFPLTSPNQQNKLIQQGKAPVGIERVDTPKVANEQLHVHVNGGALNIDGTWKHKPGSPLTNQQKNWLSEQGWLLPGN